MLNTAPRHMKRAPNCCFSKLIYEDASSEHKCDPEALLPPLPVTPAGRRATLMFKYQPARQTKQPHEYSRASCVFTQHAVGIQAPSACDLAHVFPLIFFSFVLISAPRCLRHHGCSAIINEKRNMTHSSPTHRPQTRSPRVPSKPACLRTCIYVCSFEAFTWLMNHSDEAEEDDGSEVRV